MCCSYRLRHGAVPEAWFTYQAHTLENQFSSPSNHWLSIASQLGTGDSWVPSWSVLEHWLVGPVLLLCRQPPFLWVHHSCLRVSFLFLKRRGCLPFPIQTNAYRVSPNPWEDIRWMVQAILPRWSQLSRTTSGSSIFLFLIRNSPVAALLCSWGTEAGPHPDEIWVLGLNCTWELYFLQLFICKLSILGRGEPVFTENPHPYWERDPRQAAHITVWMCGSGFSWTQDVTFPMVKRNLQYLLWFWHWFWDFLKTKIWIHKTINRSKIKGKKPVS